MDGMAGRSAGGIGQKLRERAESLLATAQARRAAASRDPLDDAPPAGAGQANGTAGAVDVTGPGCGDGGRVRYRIPGGGAPGAGGGQQAFGACPYLLADAPGRSTRHSIHLTNYG